jgi:hypothetical protein
MDSATPSLRNIKIGFVVSAVVLAPISMLIAIQVVGYAGYEGP